MKDEAHEIAVLTENPPGLAAGRPGFTPARCVDPLIDLPVHAKDECGMRNEENDLKQRTRALALRVIRLYSSLPMAAGAQVLGKQLLRSGTSVGANYREAHRARSKAEFIAKMGDCLKELDESSYWLDLLVSAEFVPAARIAPLLDETNQLIAIFVTIIKNTKANAE